MKYICFDLEGPLSPQDNAYNLMKLFNNGDKIFELISRYDDILTIEKKDNYEPGDTLALIVPFLIYHGIKEQDIIDLANKASLTGGAKDLISYLISQKWQVFCISTSYRQYALTITNRLGISSQNTASTDFPLNQLSCNFSGTDFNYLKELEDKIAKCKNLDDDWIKKNLDEFYWHKLPLSSFGNILDLIKPVGGQRKVQALNTFADRLNVPLSQFAVVGDSITDFKMLQTVNNGGGLSIAYNGNEYVLPYATIGLASLNIDDLRPVLDIWQANDRSSVKKWINNKNYALSDVNRNNFEWLDGKTDIDDYLKIHKNLRKLVREDAAKLG